jgi:hypothetical protein
VSRVVGNNSVNNLLRFRSPYKLRKYYLPDGDRLLERSISRRNQRTNRSITCMRHVNGTKRHPLRISHEPHSGSINNQSK